jgi:glycosyltransferase involved in cell wall biosynthesis
MTNGMPENSARAPSVSVGMPVYNGERFIEEALDSILAQSFGDFELVISDNASTDRTPEICRAYAARDGRIRYVAMTKNVGVVENFNAVFQLSTGRYFKWAAADDVCGPDYLRQAVDILDRDRTVVIVWARTVGIDERGDRVTLPNEVSDLNNPSSVYSPDPVVRFRRLLRNMWWVDGPFYGVVRREALEHTRWLHPHHISGDQILLVELSLKGRFHELPDETFYSRVHADKTSRRQRTLRDRAALVDRKAPGSGPAGWWRLVRSYPERLAMYSMIIWGARISLVQKVLCQAEVGRAVVAWVWLRVRQVASGASPWR